MKLWLSFPLSGMLACSAAPAISQDSSTAFIERARQATGKYQDQKIAVVEGYRRIGRDFPAMGEHWVRLDLVFDGKIDAEHPEFLTYVTVKGTPKLAGIAYALPLLGDEKPPDVPAPASAWHDHFRTIEDETILPLHHTSGAAADEARIAMLHVWIWAANPDGLFATDNWAIPYVRAGLPLSPEAPRTDAYALSLTEQGFEYFNDTIGAIVSPDGKERATIRSVLDRSRSAVELAVNGKQMDRLPGIWAQLCEELQKVIAPDRFEELISRIAICR